MQKIRAHPDARISALPMIAVTALAMSGDRERCMAAGANEYLSKPLHLENLVETIWELCKA
jgi:CheY-like chemotaxis protein